MKREVKHRLLLCLRSMEAVTGQLELLYEAHPELNDQVDIANIIPRSVDEWHADIMAKVDQVEALSTED